MTHMRILDTMKEIILKNACCAMTPLSNILTDRAETFSLSETLTRIEHDSHESIRAAQYHEQTTELSSKIELSQIKQALLDMRMQIDIIVSALDTELSDTSSTTPVNEQHQSINTHTTYVPERQYIPEKTPEPYYREQRTEYVPEQQYAQPQQHEQYKERTLAPTYGTYRMVEGVFNGQRMVGEDGNMYEVPQNYASKSKMVEGDLLKLTITAEGKQYYKQVCPIKRRSLLGELMQDPQGNWVVVVDRIPYKVLTASVTFYKARQGCQAVILVPEEGQANWGAVDSFLN